MSQSLISFRPFREEDFLPLLAWFRAPHVARWWPVPETDAAVAAKYLPRIRGEESVCMYAILLDTVPIGMAQICPVDQQHGAIPNACSLDLLIGDTSFINRGLGSRVIDVFVTAEIFGHRGFSICLADPCEDNQRSVRAFEKAGFDLRRRFQQEGQTFLILARNCPEPGL
jgi:aminoglycoside 6'-N-acetyltransferase